MDGRFFAGTRVDAYIADGSEKFKKTNAKRDEFLASLEEAEEGNNEGHEADRLDKFGSWLESEGAR